MEDLYGKYLECGGKVCTDTRRIVPGSVFFALKGENFDGNDFAGAALEQGASYAVVERTPEDADNRFIKVPDTLLALQQLARVHRMHFEIPVVGITGTNGKTTTKELVNAVLSTKYRTLCTKGNLNNHIGVPLTLLGLDKEHEIAIVEMGASHPGEIASSVSMALPTCGLITNVGRAHLEGFGSFEGVKRTKGELYDFLNATAGTVFYNADSSDICGMVDARDRLVKIPYGVRYQGIKILPADVKEPFLRIGLPGGRIVRTHLVGGYNADNVLAALCVAKHFNVDEDAAISAIEAYVPSNNRSQMMTTADNTLIVDAYNANHTSMLTSLDNFAATDFKEKVLILGDMYELGEFSRQAHADVLRKACAITQEIFLVGRGEFKAAAAEVPEAACALFFDSSQALRDYLGEHPLKGKTVLLKGSNSNRLFILPEIL
ncbi:MAG: UDP-N-acetylmuramoyl-tripeptide--D-alanyl-D-alanine ligase [Bacteroidales bacterium]|nr:UDP-N-acetylmuramoyl-tripeptide--D-alanyl-D-alanine ligase [Bacteroidales bacterium]